MAKLPQDADRSLLATVGPAPFVLPGGTRFWRVYFKGGAHPTEWNTFRAFGPTNSRFDHHETPPRVQTRAILYGAVGKTAATTCLAEVFQDLRTIDRRRNDPWLVAFELARDVTLHDLRGIWPTTVGASTSINSGPRNRARNWSRAIYELYVTIEGLHYGSSMNANEPAIALYERATSAIPNKPVGNWALADPRLYSRLVSAADRLNYALT